MWPHWAVQPNTPTAPSEMFLHLFLLTAELRWRDRCECTEARLFLLLVTPKNRKGWDKAEAAGKKKETWLALRETRSHRVGTAGNRPRINLRAAQNGEAPGRLLASGAFSAPFGLGSAGTGIKGSVLPHYNGSSKPRRWAGSPLWPQNKERQIHQIFQPFTRGKVRSALVASFLVGPARLSAWTLSRLRSTEILSNRLHQRGAPLLFFSIHIFQFIYAAFYSRWLQRLFARRLWGALSCFHPWAGYSYTVTQR